jgi:predicted GNAT superfamily acetyltransferase
MNAHFNMAKLGTVAEEYIVNLYGESTSALHRGAPTDRLVAQWRIREPHVVRRVEGQSAMVARSPEARDAPVVNPTAWDGEWRRVTGVNLAHDTGRVWVEIPMAFTEMLRRAPDRARAWRVHVREIFQACFSRGYRAVAFSLQREQGFGRYLLERGASGSAGSTGSRTLGT